MPVEQRDPKQTVKAVTLGVAAVGAAVGFLLLVLWFTDRGSVEIALGDETVDAGRIDIIADQIREDGPIRFADLTGGGQNIILQHVGQDDEFGWFAFDLIRPGQPDECQLDWIADALEFRDSCDGTVVPGIGTGQPQYPVEITDQGRISIDLRAQDTNSIDTDESQPDE